jgi:hypothetical protein
VSWGRNFAARHLSAMLKRTFRSISHARAGWAAAAGIEGITAKGMFGAVIMNGPILNLPQNLTLRQRFTNRRIGNERVRDDQ